MTIGGQSLNLRQSERVMSTQNAELPLHVSEKSTDCSNPEAGCKQRPYRNTTVWGEKVSGLTHLLTKGRREETRQAPSIFKSLHLLHSCGGGSSWAVVRV